MKTIRHQAIISCETETAQVLYIIRARIDTGRSRGARQLTRDIRALKRAEAEIVRLRAALDKQSAQPEVHFAGRVMDVAGNLVHVSTLGHHSAQPVVESLGMLAQLRAALVLDREYPDNCGTWDQWIARIDEVLSAQPVEVQRVDRDTGFNAGIVAALAVLTAFDSETQWREVLRTAGEKAVLHYAAHVESEDWEWGGFAKYIGIKPTSPKGGTK